MDFLKQLGINSPKDYYGLLNPVPFLKNAGSFLGSLPGKFQQGAKSLNDATRINFPSPNNQQLPGPDLAIPGKTDGFPANTATNTVTPQNTVPNNTVSNTQVQPAPYAVGNVPATQSNAQAVTQQQLPQTNQNQQPITNGSQLGNGFNQNSFLQDYSQQTGAYTSQISDALVKLTNLQNQLIQANAPDPQIQSVQQQIDQVTNKLNNNTVNSTLSGNPSLQNAGITQTQAENQTYQQGLPLSQQLANLALSKSVLSNTRQQGINSLNTSVGIAGNNLNTFSSLLGMQPINGIPRDIANKILENQLTPSYSATKDIFGNPIVFNEKTGQFTSPQGGIGQGIGGGIGTQGGQQEQITGYLQNTGYVQSGPQGRPYINSDRLGVASDVIKTLAAQSGIPVLTTEEIGKVRNVDITQQNLNNMGTTVGNILSNGLIGRAQGLTLNVIQDFLQTNTDISSFNSYRDTAINAIQALASGSGSGFRLNQTEIDNAIKTLPTITDNLETAQAKIQKMQGFLQNWTDQILPTQNGSGGQGNSVVQTRAGAINTNW